MPPNDDGAAMSPLRQAFAALLAAAVTLLVGRIAWVSEDAFITFRYVSNVLAGFGPVFNPGEAVQGYTHPLWFIVLVAGGTWIPDLIWLATALGLVLTAVAQLWLTRTLLLIGGATLHGGLFALLFALLCVSSDAWLSFQTSGLENALSHLLLIALASELALREPPRLLVVTGLGALLVLNRPDLAVFFLPLALVLLTRLREPRALRDVALGALPLFAWIAFALVTYGDLVPNTAHAKVGIWPSWRDGVAQGVTYLVDWVSHEPLPALAALGLLVLASVRARTTMTRAFALGLWLQLAYVVWIGGDFMRARFLLAIFVGSLALGCCTAVRDLAEQRVPERWSAAIVAALALLALGLAALAREPERGVPPSGIVDERLFYPGYAISAYKEAGRLRNPYLDLGLAERLSEYARECGPVVVHARNPGTLAYLAGPGVSVIDTLGLTDAYIARLPNETLIEARSRVGHPDKYIPLSYLARRRDISFLLGWRAAVGQKRCGFDRYTEAYLDSSESMVPGKLYPRLEDRASSR